MDIKENKAIGEKIYLLALALYIIQHFNTGIMTDFNPKIGVFLLELATAVVIFKIIIYDDVKNWKYVAYMFLAMVFFEVGIISLNYTMFYIFIFMLGAKNIEYKKILKLFIISVGFMTIVTMTLSLVDVLENLKFTRRLSSSVRFAMGTIAPTDLAARWFYLSLAYVSYKNMTLKKIEILNIFLISIIMYIITDTRLDLLLSILLVIVLVFKEQVIDIVKKLTEYKLIYLIPIIVSFITIILGYTYNSKNYIFSMLNKLLSDRLALEKRAFNDYNVKLFGQYVHQNGYGRGVKVTDYFFIDSSYVRILMMLGVVTFFIIMFFLISIEKKFLDEKLYGMVIALLFMVLSSSIDQHLLEISYNTMFLVQFATLSNTQKYNQE